MIYRNLTVWGCFIFLLALITITEEITPANKPSVDSSPKKHVIEITAFTFQPGHMNIAVGDTVVWVNNDIVPHTATANNSSWEVSTRKEGALSEAFIAEKVGEHLYYCRFHPAMKGTLTVE